ncbi:MAG: OmpA family protein [Hyphomicrobium sp.]|nr:OmpA family protein [Hyphomicrobium sp.]
MLRQILRMGLALAAAMLAGVGVGSAPLMFVAMVAVGGLVYWLLDGRRTRDLADAAGWLQYPRDRDAKQERRRCALCAAVWLLLGLIPLGLLGWQMLHRGDAPLAVRLTQNAQADAAHLLSLAGLNGVSLRVDDHTGHVLGTVPDASTKAKTFDNAKAALAPIIGLPGIVAALQNDLLAIDDTTPVVAQEDARIEAAQEATRKAEEEEAARKKAEEERLAAEAEAKRKAEEEAARKKAEEERLAAEAEAKRKAEEESARKKAEEERLAAEAEAKRKAEEEAARKKAEEERLAAEAEAKRKVEEEAARKKAEEERLAAEAEAKRKAEEEAARKKAEEERLAAEAEAKRKAEEEAARKKAEEERLAAEAEAKRKAEEEAARKKAEEERLAAEAEAKRKAEEEAARKKAEEERLTAERDEQFQACAASLAGLTGEYNILFRSGSPDLRPKHAKFLDAIAELSKSCEIMTIVIGGHSDYTGGEHLNQVLSEDRAEAVRAALVERGVDAKQLETRAYSYRQPSDGILRPYARKIERRAGLKAELRPPQATQ